MSKRKVPNENLECLVCGDFARGLNFDVISCMSCKTFFRRNVFRKSVSELTKQFFVEIYGEIRMLIFYFLSHGRVLK